MAKSSTRRINIYINGKEVEATVKGIRAEMNRLINEQNRMIMGSQEYIVHAKKIQELRGYLLTSSMRPPKNFIIKDFNSLMAFHEHCL